jgi:hypothetical protein
MAVWTEELNTSFNFPNINIYNKLRDGELRSYEIRPQDGYVMYNINHNFTEPDPETGEEVPVTYYYVSSTVPLNFDFNSFPWRAVLRSSVEEDYIFGGGGNNDHEIM